MQTVHITVKGKVQGVFFRDSAKQAAIAYGLKGWVKNTREGNVEMMVTGNSQDIEAMIKWCHSGPPKAVVENVSVETTGLQNFPDFTILRTN